jgi:hypothetical protein
LAQNLRETAHIPRREITTLHSGFPSHQIQQSGCAETSQSACRVCMQSVPHAALRDHVDSTNHNSGQAREPHPTPNSLVHFQQMGRSTGKRSDEFLVPPLFLNAAAPPIIWRKKRASSTNLLPPLCDLGGSRCTPILFASLLAGCCNIRESETNSPVD